MELGDITTAPFTEDDLDNLRGLSLAIEACTDAMIGVTCEKVAREAIPALVRLQQAEIDRLNMRFLPQAGGLRDE